MALWFALLGTNLFVAGLMLGIGLFLTRATLPYRPGKVQWVGYRTVLSQKNADTWEFAKGQWLADGHGFGRMVRAHGARAKLLIALPLAAGLRGAAVSLARRQPRWLAYYACFVLFNYVGLLREVAAGERA